MTIKVYDKVADLAGREGYKLVGSRFKKLIGSTLASDALQSKIKKAKHAGLTRLEVSFHFDESMDYCFNSPYATSYFHADADYLLSTLVDDVMNNGTMLD
jgi:hypothetical protein